MWTDDMFGVKKPIFTMLHLDPLPAIPGFITATAWSAWSNTPAQTSMRFRTAVWMVLFFPMSSACPTNGT